jgi:type II secretory pathway pseudopilin PulG
MREQETIMRRRPAFTLVELLVSMALIMFIMSILSSAFVAAAKTVRDLKASADLAERLRQASGILRRDLAADHFEAKKRMSRVDFWNDGPPKEGFFRLYQGSPPGTANYVREGIDPAELAIADPTRRLLDSYRATDHALHFTVKLRGNASGDFFSAPAPIPIVERDRRYMNNANLYTSQWAEVVYFLGPTGDTARGTPLFALYRRQFLPVDDVNVLTAPVAGLNLAAVQALGMSAHVEGRAVYFNTPGDLTMPNRRFAMAGGSYPVQTDTFGKPTGAGVLMTDVISMDVRLLLAGGTHFESLYDIAGVGTNNPRVANGSRFVYPVRNAAFSTNGPLVFDTWSATASGPDDYTMWNQAAASNHIPIFTRTDNTRIGVQAVQIVLRVWDEKTEQTRQITIAQEL